MAGVSATAKAAAWAKRLDWPITNESNTYLGFNRAELSHSASDGLVSARLNPKYVFDSFVIGQSNRFAHAAAFAVAETPAKAYNPLFIYGDSGLGKTHLLHAIGHYAKRLYPQVRVRYVNSEEFTNDFINSIRDDEGSSFKEIYRNVDMLRSTTSSSWRARSTRRRSSSTPSTRCTTTRSRS